MTSESSSKSLADAIKDRGRLFLLTFRELSKRHGERDAINTMRSISHEFGCGIGRSLACFAPDDFEGLAEAYAKAPDNGTTYSPDIKQLDDTCLDVQMMSCPIKDAWVEAGCSDEEICTLLYCSVTQDEATWEIAGFNYEITMWS
ncbi:MAG: L-2-amino-thiazoline-4-carboxylic acid hydrolase, partial [Pseudomonadota bacterium]